MNILFGVQATGNGHISRSRELVKALKRNGHEVFVLFSGRDPDKLWDVEAFEPYRACTGMTFAVKRGKVKYLATLAQLHPLTFYRDITGFNAERFDLCITDFEPVSARIARRYNIPSIGIGHQYAFKYPIPLARRDPMAMFILKHFAPAVYSIGLHWHHFSYPILPPIIPTMHTNGDAPGKGKILVYLPFEDPDEVQNLLRPFSDHHFYYYTATPHSVDEDNLHLRPFSREGFLHDLITCEGVLSNSGFELASEALHLGKKLLVRPLAGQLEQESNALALERLRLGTVMHRLDAQILRTWLYSPPGRPVHYPDVARHIAAWIGTGLWNTSDKLVQEVWSQVDMHSFSVSF